MIKEFEENLKDTSSYQLEHTFLAVCLDIIIIIIITSKLSNCKS